MKWWTNVSSRTRQKRPAVFCPATTRTVPLSAASRDDAVATNMVPVNGPSKSQNHRRLHRRSRRARAELLEKRTSRSRSGNTSTSNQTRNVTFTRKPLGRFLLDRRAWASVQISRGPPCRWERSDGVLPSCYCQSCFDALATSSSYTSLSRSRRRCAYRFRFDMACVLQASKRHSGCRWTWALCKCIGRLCRTCTKARRWSTFGKRVKRRTALRETAEARIANRRKNSFAGTRKPTAVNWNTFGNHHR